MANREFFYFYAPSWDYPPEGPIKLGNVITSVKKPHIPLINAPPTEYAGIFKTEKKSVQYTKEKLRSGRFSILTKFLSVFGFGVDVGTAVERSDEERFMFDTLRTTQFIPTEDYLQRCVDSENVRRWLAKSSYRKPIYVITGVKLVTGAELNTKTSRVIGGNLALEVDGTVWSGGAVPIGGGPGIEGRVGNRQETKWEGGNFVFAFRVSKVRVKRCGQIASEVEFRHGAMLDLDLDLGLDLGRELGQTGLHNITVEQPKAYNEEFDVITVEEPKAHDEGFEEEKLMEDDEEILCAIPTEGDFDE